MKRYLWWSIAFVVAAALVIVFWVLPRGSQTSSYDRYITVADVEKATGLGGLNVKESGNGLEFNTGFFGSKLLEIRFMSASFYEKEVMNNWRYYEPVPGIGEKAAVREPHLSYRLTFLKGDRCVVVQTFPKDNRGQLPIGRAQLTAVGKIIAGRM